MSNTQCANSKLTVLIWWILCHPEQSEGQTLPVPSTTLSPLLFKFSQPLLRFIIFDNKIIFAFAYHDLQKF